MAFYLNEFEDIEEPEERPWDLYYDEFEDIEEPEERPWDLYYDEFEDIEEREERPWDLYCEFERQGMLSDSSEFIFPSHAAKRNKKPKTTIQYSHQNSELRSSLVRSLYTEIVSKEPVNIENVITFLYMYARDSMKAKLQDDWKTYGITIGNAYKTITPLNIIDVELEYQDFKHLKTTNIALPPKDDWLAFYLCMFYRLSKLTSDHGAYNEKLANDAKERMLKISDHNAIKTLSFHALNVSAYYFNPNYCKLIAAFDMFLYKFRNHSAGFCRFGTRDSRLRDCAALSSYLYTRKSLGMKNIEELAKWFIETPLKIESTALLSNKVEHSNEYSYLMYQKDFGLLNDAAYSAAVNPHIDFVCNVILALLGDERGVRAKNLLATNQFQMSLIKNATIIAYVFDTRTHEESALGPKCRDFNEWARFMQPKGWKLTADMEKWSKERRAKISRTYGGTVGECLQRI